MNVLVIGGGHNGLVAASYLARAGMAVTVLEQRSVVGGLCGTSEIFPGFHGNTGSNTPHNLEPRVIADMELHRHGLRFETVEPSSFMMFRDGRKLVGWQDEHALAEEIRQFDRHDVDGYFGLFADLASLAARLDVSFFEPPPTFGEIVNRLDNAQHQQELVKLVFGSATDLLEPRLRSREMRASLAMVSITGTQMGPSTAGSAYGLFHRPLYRGSNLVRKQRVAEAQDPDTEASVAPFSKATPLGGMGAITGAMERSARSVGVQIRTDVCVASISCDGGFVTGVVLSSGEQIDAQIVVSNVDPATTLLDLVSSDTLPEDVKAVLRDGTSDGCMSKINLALDGTPRFRCANDDAENAMLLRAGFRVAPEDMDAAAEGARLGEWYDEPMTYGFIPSATDPSMAPPGKHIMSLSVAGSPYALAEGSWDSRRDEWVKHVVKNLTEHIPNLPDLISDYHCATPTDIESEFGARRGNITHVDLTSARLLGWHPLPGWPPYSTPISGLYLCSVGNWPGNYVSGIPGMNAASKIVNDLRANGGRPPESVGEPAVTANDTALFDSGVS